MALPAIDDFNRSDGPVGSNWTALQNSAGDAHGHQIDTNQCEAAAEAYCFSVWNADAFNADHYSQFVVVNVIAYSGPVVRMPASGFVDGYLWLSSFGADGRLYRLDDGTLTQLQTGVGIPANGSVIKLTAEGADLKMFDDGAQVGSTQTDSTYATGAPGIWVAFNSGSNAKLDDWEGSNMAVGAPPAMGGTFPLRRTFRPAAFKPGIAR